MSSHVEAGDEKDSSLAGNSRCLFDRQLQIMEEQR